MEVRAAVKSRVGPAYFSGTGVQIRAFVEPELRRKIERTSELEDITMSEVVRRALRTYFDIAERG